VPSCSYPDADVALFDEIVDSVAGLGDPQEAGRIFLDVECALLAGSSRALLAAVSDRWPSLTPLVLVTGANQDAQRRILRILKTVFGALASTRRAGSLSVGEAASTASPPRFASRKS